MKPKVARAAALAAAAGGAPAGPAAADLTVRPEALVELRLFLSGPADPRQFEALQGAVALTGEARWRSEDRAAQIRVEPYLRLDQQDDERTYFDLREASFDYRFGDFDLTLGASQVFWGVAEAHNPVDIINQIDALEDVDGDEKLGQPMARLSWRGGFGLFEAYYMPFFRERGFPGVDGRLRTVPAVDGDAAVFTRDGDEFAGDFAVRYANRFGDVDLGVHAFYGTGRDPDLVFDAGSGLLVPVYRRLAQTGVDAQFTDGPWLLKAEGVLGEFADDVFFAGVAGFEYTFFDVAETGADLGLIAEYLYDERGDLNQPRAIFDNDVFAGARITLNDVADTELLAGAIVDHDTGAVQASVEFQRRIGERSLLEAEFRQFSGSKDPFVGSLTRDDYFTLRLIYFF
ncbi:MAG: hypothetical protein AAF322_00010 [Pseudomonadota bacterium]